MKIIHPILDIPIWAIIGALIGAGFVFLITKFFDLVGGSFTQDETLIKFVVVGGTFVAILFVVLYILNWIKRKK